MHSQCDPWVAASMLLSTEFLRTGAHRRHRSWRDPTCEPRCDGRDGARHAGSATRVTFVPEDHPDARKEYLDAIAYNDRQRVGLGDELMSRFEDAIQEIVADPEVWSQSRAGTRTRNCAATKCGSFTTGSSTGSTANPDHRVCAHQPRTRALEAPHPTLTGRRLPDKQTGPKD